jgi:hypothetical protein
MLGKTPYFTLLESEGKHHPCEEQNQRADEHQACDLEPSLFIQRQHGVTGDSKAEVPFDAMPA